MSKILAYIGLFFAVTIWSISFVSIDHCLEYMSATQVNIVRFTIATLFLWGIYLIRGQKMKFEKSDIIKIGLSGMFGTAAYYFFQSISLDYVSPTTATIITGAIPIMTLVVAMLFTGKRTRFRNILFIAMSFVGVIVLTGSFDAVSSNSYIGIGIVLLANLCWVIYTIIGEPLNHKYDKLNLITMQIFCGTVMYYVLYMYQLYNNTARMIDINLILGNEELLFQLIFLSIMSSVVAYYLYNYALQKVGLTISALFINVIPVATLIISVAVGNEVLSFEKIIGCLLVVLAVYLIDDI